MVLFSLLLFFSVYGLNPFWGESCFTFCKRLEIALPLWERAAFFFIFWFRFYSLYLVRDSYYIQWQTLGFVGKPVRWAWLVRMQTKGHMCDTVGTWLVRHSNQIAYKDCGVVTRIVGILYILISGWYPLYINWQALHYFLATCQNF